MKKIIILIPVFNDWDSFCKLLDEINENIKFINNYEFKCIAINDCSTVKMPNIKKPLKIESVKILNMKKNKGHARCNAFGIRYIIENETPDYVILMDGDGEDRPIEIKSLINKINAEPNVSVVAKRIKRSEGVIFRSMYQIHKIITFIFTGKNINFGNYSCLTLEDLKNLSNKASLWSSFSGSVKKYIKKFNEIDSIRGTRYYGPSKMSLLNLLIHSFSIIAVFKYSVFFRSSILLFISFVLYDSIFIFVVFFQFMLILFNLLIYLISLRENETDLLNSHFDLVNKIDITH
tara:strand:- start:1597 stop:2469 length:873 start_codon:yes stop_codon:yes gene_type:complete